MKPERLSIERWTVPEVPKRARIMGLGNVLRGDDGFGPLTVELFRSKYECDQDIEILDVGTPGLDLAPYLYGPGLVVIVDSVHAHKRPGTLCIYQNADLPVRRSQLRMTAHDPGVQESLAHLRLAGHVPSEVVIVGAVPESCGPGTGLSAAVLSASSAAVNSIARLLAERGIECRCRVAPLQPNLWWLLGDRSDSRTSTPRMPEGVRSIQGERIAPHGSGRACGI